jgi:hypothetical protein
MSAFMVKLNLRLVYARGELLRLAYNDTLRN